MNRKAKTLVYVRGIYASAITGILLDHGFGITRPSTAIQERFRLSDLEEPPDVSIEDCEGGQSVKLEGHSAAIEQVLAAFRETLSFFALRDCERSDPGTCLELDLPAPAKEELDRLRARHLFTIPGHHYLRLLHPDKADEAEEQALQDETQTERIIQGLLDELVYQHLKPGATLEVRHQKAGQGSFSYAGTISRFRPGLELILDRQFRGSGSYDSLDVPIEKEDYGKVEFYLGQWHFRRRYFSATGELKGEIYNINTPPELFPKSLHYLDLEVDVVRWPDGVVKIVDEGVLEQKLHKGQVSHALAGKALDEARKILARLT
jgi:hypothetical protein